MFFANASRTFARCYSARPAIDSVLPKKKTLSRLLFDHDSRLAYKKVMPIFTNVYENLENPTNIRLPHYTKHQDLMTLRSVLRDIRALSNAVNKNLVDLENELIEQAAELGNNDAIAMLAFEAIGSPETSKEDYEYANKLIGELQDARHPLVFKLAGDLAFSKNYHEQAAQYWNDFLELEDDSIIASHVYTSLGMYYFNFAKPEPDLARARVCLEKAIKFGELDTSIIKAHYYLGQLYSMTDPKRSRYHLEISASKGLQESFPSLGFLELNVFDNPSKALEWFKLGVEGNNDITCLVGQFDAHIRTKNFKKASSILANLQGLKKKLDGFAKHKFRNVPDAFKGHAETNYALLVTFFDTRKDVIHKLPSQVL
ncbi:hypothetical protein FT663_04439 [Candidozyma haemuli var. vulneris]|uniref:Protein MSS2, mitochondrial n=1 Tax=Candidozyma haemuli TaxID=45357 RepID=A0A2V1AU11_9ASCO|nr:hypothetical protein CXQ85_004290 [[Candida] haemuloni]KAF3987445.1 hypothetical protein FT663_04439 [[Candida] haemuloni var. vulneris]KAF3991751.1 hypothetical protein FT662_01505 [[Candida] haemuloni var. vulneris]PVH20783.1 hypothetical protein CXQ85_004290 [[Candida] haemuloni]